MLRYKLGLKITYDIKHARSILKSSNVEQTFVPFVYARVPHRHSINHYVGTFLMSHHLEQTLRLHLLEIKSLDVIPIPINNMTKHYAFEHIKKLIPEDEDAQFKFHMYYIPIYYTSKKYWSAITSEIVHGNTGELITTERRNHKDE